MNVRNLGSWAPAIAIVFIVVTAVVADYFLVPEVPGPGPTPAPAPVAATPTPVPPEAVEPVPAPVAPVAPPDHAEVWSMYHGSPSLTGYSKRPLPERLGVRWQYQAEGGVYQPPVGDDSRVYVATRTGRVVALDHGGGEVWTTQMLEASDGKPARLDAPISLVQSTLLVASSKGTLRALDVSNGDVTWTYDVGGAVFGAVNFAPSLDDDGTRLFLLRQDDGVVHCLDLASGRNVWLAEPVGRADGSLAVSGTNVVFGSCVSALHVVAQGDGRHMRKVPVGADCQIASGPALVGDEIYSGSRCGHFLRVGISGSRIIWTSSDGTSEIFTTPAVTDRLVVFGAEDGYVYALDRESGKQAWRCHIGGPAGSPVVAIDKVLVAAEGILYSLSLDTGQELWKYEVSDDITSPSLVGDMVVVGSEDGTVVAFGAERP